MADLTAQRTLVKSPPELWSELSQVESLAKHLGELGEIRITKVEPESTVAWEGEEVSGTVELEQSGWGTKVTFKATVPEPGPIDPEPTAVPLEPEPEPEPVGVAPDAEPAAVAPDPEPSPAPVAAEREPATATAEPTEEEPAAGETGPERRPGFLARWLFRLRQPLPEPDPIEPEPTAVAPVPEPTPEPVAAATEPVSPEPDPVVEPEPEAAKADTGPEPIATTTTADRVQQVLDGTLDALGQAHHRPFSRG